MVVNGPRSNFAVTADDVDLVSVKSFQVITPGIYVLEANGEPGPVTSVGVGPASKLNNDAPSEPPQDPVS